MAVSIEETCVSVVQHTWLEHPWTSEQKSQAMGQEFIVTIDDDSYLLHVISVFNSVFKKSWIVHQANWKKIDSKTALNRKEEKSIEALNLEARTYWQVSNTEPLYYKDAIAKRLCSTFNRYADFRGMDALNKIFILGLIKEAVLRTHSDMIKSLVRNCQNTENHYAVESLNESLKEIQEEMSETHDD